MDTSVVVTGGAGDLLSIDKFDEEFEALFKLEFADAFNSWLSDTLEIANRSESNKETTMTTSKENVNQISRFVIN